MSEALRTAVLQMTVGPDIGENVRMTEQMIRQAAAGGARLIATPENTCHIRAAMTEKLQTVPAADQHPMLAMAARLADELNVHILLGSVSVRGAGDKLLNRSFLYRAGQDAPVTPVTYDKIHLFDANLGPGQVYQESAVFAAGNRAVVADVDGFKLGLTICYDLRFPGFYRDLAAAGADVIAVPAAFTVPSGSAHWHVLLRARAIENGVYILAPAQVGTHAGGRQTYGHSMIIDPWGRVLAEMTEPRPGVLYATLERAMIAGVRAQLMSLAHAQTIERIDRV